jgi:hypothetical protein
MMTPMALIAERRFAGRVLVLLALLTTLGGCGVPGTWRLAERRPAGAAFDYGVLRLATDGTYTAVRDEPLGIREEAGRYTYDAERQTLMLTPDGGAPRRYDAAIDACGRLRISPAEDGETWRAVFVR